MPPPMLDVIKRTPVWYRRALWKPVLALCVLASLCAVSLLTSGLLRGGGAGEEAARRAELGRATWTLLHRLAAGYDAAPTPARQATAAAFFGALGELYPCTDCAAHFRGLLEANPPEVASNSHLSLWLCGVHNQVNARLGKPAFPCNLESLGERYGHCGCFNTTTVAVG